MTTYDLQITQGADFNLTLNISDNNGNPINLSGAAISGFINYNYSTGISLISLNPSITNFISGTVALQMLASGTMYLPITVSPYSVNVSFTGLGTNSQILCGNAYVNPSIFGVYQTEAVLPLTGITFS